MLSTVLIIDKRKELSTKYKKCLESLEITSYVARTLKDGISEIQNLEPDIIIVSDSIDEDLAVFCKRIRALTYNTRPIIIGVSKSADFNDRIKILESGADDFLSEPVNMEEFKSRIKAHLRREIESNLDNKTLLPSGKYVIKNLKRLLGKINKQAVLLIGLDNLDSYKRRYSEVAGDKLVQTLVAIIKSTLSEEDFLGQLNDEDFIVITNSYSAEKMAEFLSFAFDTVVPKFYSGQDVARGYMLMQGDRLAGMRANFVSIQISGVMENFEFASKVDGLLEKLYSLKKMAKLPAGSNYIMDRIKLAGDNSADGNYVNNKIYIKEPDEALALLLRTTLELQGYDIADEIDLESSNQPVVMIIDARDDLSELEFCREMKSMKNFVNTTVIVTSTVHDKTAVLDAGADLYLPKPYEISDLIRWVEYFLRHRI